MTYDGDEDEDEDGGDDGGDCDGGCGSDGNDDDIDDEGSENEDEDEDVRQHMMITRQCDVRVNKSQLWAEALRHWTGTLKYLFIFINFKSTLTIISTNPSTSRLRLLLCTS